jgi:2,3-bisphosphoglycerate-dependent phosphoglycerate mutase
MSQYYYVWVCCFLHCLGSRPTWALVVAPKNNGDAIPTSHNHHPVHTLLLCRHGDSIWNGGEPGTRETFTGWTDVPLSPKGVQEAKNTGEQVASQYTLGIDACFTSILQRAQLTAHYCLWAFQEKPSGLAPRRYIQDYRLNERHYGALQGLIKEEAAKGTYGHDPAEVQKWRRSWYTVPPLLEDDDPRRIEDVKKYATFCGGPEDVPRGESLEQVAKNRIRPFLDQVLSPVLNEAASQRRGSNNCDGQEGSTGLVVAHANSLRALIGVLAEVENDPAALKKLEALRLQTGVPLVMKYRQLPDGTYQVCDLNGLPFDKSRSTTVTTQQEVDLPVFPLSCIPMASPATGVDGLTKQNNHETSRETTKMQTVSF